MSRKADITNYITIQNENSLEHCNDILQNKTCILIFYLLHLMAFKCVQEKKGFYDKQIYTRALNTMCLVTGKSSRISFSYWNKSIITLSKFNIGFEGTQYIQT